MAATPVVSTAKWKSDLLSTNKMDETDIPDVPEHLCSPRARYKLDKPHI